MTQCMRCLHFGHGTRNCRMNPRCNNCAQPHVTEECSIVNPEAYKCANCGDQHRANERVCVKRSDYISIRKQASTRNQPGRRVNNPPPVTISTYPNLPPTGIDVTGAQRQGNIFFPARSAPEFSK